MVMHEIGGILALIVGGAIFIAAISKNAATGTVLDASFSGFAKLINAMTAPVSGG